MLARDTLRCITLCSGGGTGGIGDRGVARILVLGMGGLVVADNDETADALAGGGHRGGCS